MSVIDKARELALLIIETDEYKKLKDAEAQFETDEKSMQLMTEYQEIQNGMLAKLQADATQEEIEAENQRKNIAIVLRALIKRCSEKFITFESASGAPEAMF